MLLPIELVQKRPAQFKD